MPRLRRSPIAGAFLDGVNVASVALMGVVAVQLAHAAFVGVVPPLVALATVGLLVRKVNAMWIVLAGAAVRVVHALLVARGG